MANNLIGNCPVCGGLLEVTRLQCGQCGTEIHGQFSISRLHRLEPEDLLLVETMVKHRGNLVRVADELAIPYSTLRSRLTVMIRRLGYEADNEAAEGAPEPTITPERRKQILDDLADGKLTSEVAVSLLQGEMTRPAQ